MAYNHIRWMLVFLGFASLIYASCKERQQPSEPEADAVGEILMLSDIHFNPYYDTSLVSKLAVSDPDDWRAIFETSAISDPGTYGDDCNYPLLRSTLDHMKATLVQPDYIIIAGDLLCHHFNQNAERYAMVKPIDDAGMPYVQVHEFVEKTLQFLTLQIEQSFPGIPVFSSLGNNDAYCGNYLVQPNSAFLTDVMDIWQPALHVDRFGTYRESFQQGGYYSIPSPVDSTHRIIVLNTTLLTDFYNVLSDRYCAPSDLGPNQDGPGEHMLEWLRGQLRECRDRDEKAWLIQHIPPGVNVFYTIPSDGEGCLKDTAYFMKEKFNTAYLDIIREFAGVISGNIASHYHKDDFRLIYQDNKAVSFIHILPAVSPVYYNNPGYEVVSYNRQTAALLDYSVYFVDLDTGSTGYRQWLEEYNYQKVYRVEDISTAAVEQIYRALETDTPLQNQYLHYYPTSYKPSFPSDQKNFRYYWCGIGNLTKQRFAACVCSDGAARP